jgi:F0F1-type ATP synthase delta subunit
MVKVYSKIKLAKNLCEKVLEVVNAKSVEQKYTLEEIQFIEDTSILSGIRIDIDSEIIDLTLNNKLTQILDVLS